MGFGSVGIWEVVLILAVLLLVFGAKRLPEIGAALGKGIREFKGSVRDIESEINRPPDRSRGDLPRSEAPRESTQEAPRAEPRQDEPAPRAEPRQEPAPRTEPRPEAPRAEEPAQTRSEPTPSEPKSSSE